MRLYLLTCSLKSGLFWLYHHLQTESLSSSASFMSLWPEVDFKDWINVLKRFARN